MKTEILLEDEVKCKFTGVKGVVTSKTEFVNGCIQFGVVQKWNPKIPLENAVVELSIDSQSLVITKKGSRHEKIIKKKKEFTGGPSRVMRRRM